MILKPVFIFLSTTVLTIAVVVLREYTVSIEDKKNIVNKDARDGPVDDTSRLSRTLGADEIDAIYVPAYDLTKNGTSNNTESPSKSNETGIAVWDRKEKNYTIFAAGDICSENAHCEKTADIILSDPDTDHVLALGDLAYEDGTDAEFRLHYDPYWGKFRNKTFPVLGNHEDDYEGYFNYWGSSDDRKTSPGIKGEGFYSFDLGDSWHVAALNTDKWKSDQRRWLEKDLNETARPCKLVFGHHTRYSPGKYGPFGSKGVPDRMKDIFSILVEAGVDLYLSGHDHIYSRYAKQDARGNAKPQGGTRQFLLGLGGTNSQPIFNPSMENLEASFTADKTFGVLRLVLQRDGYDFSFVTTKGDFSDTGSTRCNLK